MKGLLFVGVASALILSSVATASHQPVDDLQTPQRSVVTAAVEPSPGERVCRRQAQILTRENFLAVLDPQVVDSWGVDWGVFQNASTSIDDPARIGMMRLLNNRLTLLSNRNFDDAFVDLSGKFFAIRGQIEGVHGLRLDTVAMAYFSRLFPPNTLSYQPKRDGVQLGERIIINQGQPNKLTYHVKTHSAGRLSSHSTAAKLVNPQELMAYRILQYLGVGCETHFFERSPEDVYIATLDAGTGGSFTLFEVMSGHLGRGGNDEACQHLTGGLINMSQNPSELNIEAIEASVITDAVAQNFMTEIARLDIITRVLRLHDLLNNPDNFGFFESPTQQNPTVRVIDFRIMETRIFEIDNGDFGGFLVGNGLYQYAGSHKTMRYVLHDRPRPTRVKTAKNIMESSLATSMKAAIGRAHHDILNYIEQAVFEPRHTELMPKLEKYRNALIHNAEFFMNKLQEWTPEADAAREAEYAKYGRQETTQ